MRWCGRLRGGRDAHLLLIHSQRARQRKAERPPCTNPERLRLFVTATTRRRRVTLDCWSRCARPGGRMKARAPVPLPCTPSLSFVRAPVATYGICRRRGASGAHVRAHECVFAPLCRPVGCAHNTRRTRAVRRNYVYDSCKFGNSRLYSCTYDCVSTCA